MSDKSIFISHRSTDKDIADLLESFMTRCGIPSGQIFCSSLPGNDVQHYISSEIKQALSTSKLNIVLLSSSYYESPYCQNEAGIIWFLDTKKVVIGLPEINEHIMEGFLNSENKIRRLANLQDIQSISDILRSDFPGFTSSFAKASANMEKLQKEYNQILQNRSIQTLMANTGNKLEARILAGEFTDDEYLVLLYFYETQSLTLYNDYTLFKQWLINSGIDRSIKSGVEKSLIADGLMEVLINERDDILGASLVISAFRELLKLSSNGINTLKKIAQKHLSSTKDAKSVNSNEFDRVICNLPEDEQLLICYIIDLEKNTLFSGWQESMEVTRIRTWEEVNNLNSKLSSNYNNVLSKLIMRKFLEVSAKTSNGNPKEYIFRKDIYDGILQLESGTKKQLVSILESNKTIIDWNDLPF